MESCLNGLLCLFGFSGFKPEHQTNQMN